MSRRHVPDPRPLRHELIGAFPAFIVTLRSEKQSSNAFHNLAHPAFVFLEALFVLFLRHYVLSLRRFVLLLRRYQVADVGSDQLDGLRQGLVAFGQSVEPFVGGHISII